MPKHRLDKAPVQGQGMASSPTHRPERCCSPMNALSCPRCNPGGIPGDIGDSNAVGYGTPFEVMSSPWGAPLSPQVTPGGGPVALKMCSGHNDVPAPNPEDFVVLSVQIFPHLFPIIFGEFTTSVPNLQARLWFCGSHCYAVSAFHCAGMLLKLIFGGMMPPWVGEAPYLARTMITPTWAGMVIGE